MRLKVMRPAITILAACLLSAAASAQTERKVWTAAPVPGDLRQTVPPADRAGGVTGTDNSSPFSAVPSGARTGSQPSDTTRDSGPGTDSATPNLSK